MFLSCNLHKGLHSKFQNSKIFVEFHLFLIGPNMKFQQNEITKKPIKEFHSEK
jgi:hypothetical protein